MPGGQRAGWTPDGEQTTPTPPKKPTVAPKASRHDPAPYVAPTGDGSGGSAPPPGYAAAPVLSMAWTQIPDFTGDIHKTAGTDAGESTADANPHNAISVNLSSIRAAETSMMATTASVVQDYNALHEKVLTAMNTEGFYGENATYYASWGVSHDSSIDLNQYYANGGATTTGGADQIHDDTNIRNMANQFAPIINPMMSRALRQFGDTVTAIGQVINYINLAGQSYTVADRHSHFPPPDPNAVILHEADPENHPKDDD
jgi:hypothetical protein